MLAIGNARELIERVWHGLGCQVQLPEDWEDYFQHTGLAPIEYDDRRSYARMHMRGKAVLHYAGLYYAIYTRDVSRGGVAFYFMQQIFPGERGRIWLATGLSHDVEIARCKRHQASCYECGARFVAAQS
jgi:hypothetical protein